MSTITETNTEAPAPRKRGFAACDPAVVREIARKGGQTAHALGRAHRFAHGSEKAREAGRKGGATRARKAAERKAAEQSKAAHDAGKVVG